MAGPTPGSGITSGMNTLALGLLFVVVILLFACALCGGGLEAPLPNHSGVEQWPLSSVISWPFVGSSPIPAL